MSNFSRSVKRKKKKPSVMKQSDDIYFFGGYPIVVYSYNYDYFESSKSLIEGYGLVFADYCEKAEMDRNISLVEFLKDSIDNNYMLCDYIRECDFTIKDSHIVFSDNGDDTDFINMGQFTFRNCKINVFSSYLFVEDLSTDIKYLYYGD